MTLFFNFILYGSNDRLTSFFTLLGTKPIISVAITNSSRERAKHFRIRVYMSCKGNKLTEIRIGNTSGGRGEILGRSRSSQRCHHSHHHHQPPRSSRPGHTRHGCTSLECSEGKFRVYKDACGLSIGWEFWPAPQPGHVYVVRATTSPCARQLLLILNTCQLAVSRYFTFAAWSLPTCRKNWL